MELDKIAEILMETRDMDNAELVVYRKKNGNVTKETVSFRFYPDGDYQWSTSNKPI